jgi:hypothetical protein
MPVPLKRQETQTWTTPDGKWVHPFDPPPSDNKTETNANLSFMDNLSFNLLFPQKTKQSLSPNLESSIMDDKWMSTEPNVESSIEVKSPMFIETPMKQPVIENTDFTIPTPAHIRLEMSRDFCNNI